MRTSGAAGPTQNVASEQGESRCALDSQDRAGGAFAGPSESEAQPIGERASAAPPARSHVFRARMPTNPYLSKLAAGVRPFMLVQPAGDVAEAPREAETAFQRDVRDAFRRELSERVVAPEVRQDMPDADSATVLDRARQILDGNVAWARIHIFGDHSIGMPALERRAHRARLALQELRRMLRNFTDTAESLEAARQKDGGPMLGNEAAVAAVAFVARRLLGADPVGPLEPRHQIEAARRALGKHKEVLEPRALLVLDIDRPGLLSAEWIETGKKNPKGEPEYVRAPHLSLRHLAMFGVLAGIWPDQPNAKGTAQIVKAETNALRGRLTSFGLRGRVRADDLRVRPTRRSSPRRSSRAPRHG
jgi:hypothetical protein